jgi:branched-chain amino acid transport system substrate-binding protein
MMKKQRIPMPSRAMTRRQFSKAALAASGVAALGGPAPAILAQTTKLKVGIVLPLSGFLAQPGQSCQRGADIAPTLLSEMGLHVELLSADTESNADVARSRAEKLIDDGCHVLVGAFDSGHTAAVAQVAEQRGVPLVINVAAAPLLTEQGYRTVFRNFPTSPTLVRNGLALMKDLFQATGKTPATAIFMYANDTFGQANKAAVDTLLPPLRMPFKLLESISYDPKAQDLSIEVAKAKASAAELVIVTTRAGDAIMLIREMVKQRYEPMGVISPGSPGFYDEQFYKSLGRYADFAISNLPWVNPRSELARRLESTFRKRFPNDRYECHAFNVGFTFEAVLVAADAAKRAGTTDPKALLEALRRTDLPEHVMIGGPIRFDAKGQNDGIGSVTVQNRNQRPTVVLPKATAELDPVFPVPGWQRRT